MRFSWWTCVCVHVQDQSRGAAELLRRQEELERKAAELDRREREMQSLSASGGQTAKRTACGSVLWGKSFFEKKKQQKHKTMNGEQQYLQP